MAIFLLILVISAIYFWVRWALSPAKQSIKPTLSALQPECSFVVSFDEERVLCERPDGAAEQVEWKDLERVQILTTADGPLAPDVFWVLSGRQSGCVIPWGASGSSEFLQRLQGLEGFDSTPILKLGTEEAWHLCWQRRAE